MPCSQHIPPEAAWADWPDTVSATARAVAHHVSRGEPELAVRLLEGMLADVEFRHRLMATLSRQEVA